MSARVGLLLLAITVPVMTHQTQTVSFQDVMALPAPAADHRIAYGTDAQQFGELRLPRAGGAGPHPVVLLVHGGCWLGAYDITHSRPMAAALADAGYAVWSIEYRRIGQPGGGWPGTFLDVAAGADYLRTLAPRHNLDLDRVLAAGHSAGGQLVLWLAARGNSAVDGPLATERPLRLRGVVGLAAITDLATYGSEAGSCNTSVYPLMGGTPAEHPDRYAAVSPIERAPRVPVRLVHGDADRTVRLEQAERYATRMASSADVKVVPVPGAAHFDVIAPVSPAWSSVLRALSDLR